jgi:glycerophosphoryl diester phosphodiesterase
MKRRLGLFVVLAALTAGAHGAHTHADPASARSAAEGTYDIDDRTNRPTDWTLESRATLSADYIAEGPPSGAQVTAANGRTGPFPGQVIPGFSGLVANRDGTFWALPDNGFGAKTNSADFLLRLYLVHPDWQTGAIEPLRFLSLSDPHRHVPFPIVNESTADRLLTGADFDIESVVKMRDGSFWIGEEFGPFLLHVDRRGRVLSPPVPFVDGKSPQNPTLAADEVPVVPRSRGFEALGSSRNGRYLYPIVEGGLTNDPELRRRWIYEFDTRKETYTGRKWAYEVDADINVIGDVAMVDKHRMIVIERDDLDGPAAVTKKLYEFDLRETDDRGYLTKELTADLLYIDNPDGIPAEGEAAGYGLGQPFSFPMQSVESLVVLDDDRLVIANDNNYPGNAARNPGTPDDTEMIVIRRGVETEPSSESEPIVIGHRGASGYRPEHTLAAYELAIRQCADYIEPDLVSTKDGVLVARHENDITGTTDVATRAEFADRRTTKTIDGTAVTGWFTEDFTLAELRTLRAIERLPALRSANTIYDGRFDIPTFEEVIQLAQRYRTCDGRTVGVYPETKHPTYFDSIGLSMEEPLVELLDAYGYDDEDSAVYIQSFETGNLLDLDALTDVSLVQLINCSGAPYDLVVAGDPRTYADLAGADGLAHIAEYADGVGVCKNVMIPRTPDNTLGVATSVVVDAHAAGLLVHGWTFRAENEFLPAELRGSAVPSELGDMTAEIGFFLDLGIDGLFTDQPDIGVGAVSPSGCHDRSSGHACDRTG